MSYRSHIPPLLVAVLLAAGCATTNPLRTAQDYFKEGERLYAHKNYDDAVVYFKRAKESYFSPEMTANAELRIADTHVAAEKYIEAAAAYEEFRKAHPLHEQAPYALYQQGLCAYKQITGIDTDQTPVTNAMTLFEQYLQKYPGREHAKDVADLLAACRDKQLQYELYVGQFYVRTEKFSAAIRRLEGALKRFPASLRHDATLFALGQAYLKSGDPTKGRDAFDRLAKEYPASPLVKKASEFLAGHF